MKIVLAGSPSISVAAFEQVIKNFEVVAIVTQPDREKGRGMVKQETPVALLGKKYNIPVFKPEKIGLIKEDLRALDFDLLLSFAFGQYIPSSVLEIGKYKPLNIHGSLLPKYRGAAPIHYAILNGDKEIGITLMEMIKEMDAGDMFFKASKQISLETTTSQAFEIVSELAAENIVSWLKEVEGHKVTPTKQSEDFTLSPKIEKEFGLLTSELSAYETIRRIKGLNSNPGAYTFINQKRVKILNASELKVTNSLEISTKDKTIYATEYQFEGKKIVKLD